MRISVAFFSFFQMGASSLYLFMHVGIKCEAFCLWDLLELFLDHVRFYSLPDCRSLFASTIKSQLAEASVLYGGCVTVERNPQLHCGMK